MIAPFDMFGSGSTRQSSDNRNGATNVQTTIYIFGILYDDSYDNGFAIKSAHTSLESAINDAQNGGYDVSENDVIICGDDTTYSYVNAETKRRPYNGAAILRMSLLSNVPLESRIVVCSECGKESDTPLPMHANGICSDCYETFATTHCIHCGKECSGTFRTENDEVVCYDCFGLV